MDSPHYIPIHSFIPLFLPNGAEQAQAPEEHIAQYQPQAAPPGFAPLSRHVALQSSEREMHRALSLAVNASGAAPGYVVARTRDEGVQVSGLYPAADPPSNGFPRWDSLEMTIHCFQYDGDPFGEGVEADRVRENMDEILSHTARLLARQHRQHLFTVIIIGELVRLARITRPAVFITNPVSYVENPHVLADFFSRYAQLSRAHRGHDITATLVLPGTDDYTTMLEAGERILPGAADYARRCFRDSLHPAWPWYKLAVYQPGSFVKHFLVARTHFHHARMNDHRGAKGYVALSLDEPDYPFVFLKDTWRWRPDFAEAEGSRLAELNAHGVRNVPTLVCHGDVPGQTLDVMKLLQRAQGRTFGSPAKPAPKLVFTHYRVVVREVGKPLRHFRNGRELVSAFKDCVEAHRDAYVLAQMLHRDISPGNMLMVPTDSKDGEVAHKGMLTDWEMSESVKEGAVRMTRRIGTYQYLSVKAMDYPQEFHTVADELEAFIHVLIKMCIRYLPHDCADPAALHAAYYNCQEAGPRAPSECSSLKRRCIEEGVLQTPEGKEVEFLMPEKAQGGHRGPAQLGAGRYIHVPRTHPVEEIVSPLLLAASSRHLRVEEARERSKRDASKENVEPQPGHEIMQRTPQKKADPKQSPATPTRPRPPLGDANTNPSLANPSATTTLPDSDKDLSGLDAELAEAFETHGLFITLLSSALREKEWPRTDKTRDQVLSPTDEDVDEHDGSYVPQESSGSSGGSTSESDSESGSFAGEKACSDAEEGEEEEDVREKSTTSGKGAVRAERPGKRAWSESSLEDYESSSDGALAKRMREL